jgi:Zn-dependent peptidase ImmA (M78 family)
LQYEEVKQLAYERDANIVEMDFDSGAKGLCIGKCIVLSSDLKDNREKSCILAEELGHYLTTVGDISAENSIDERKQERLARVYAYEMLVGLEGIVNAWESGCRNLCEMAEFLDVTEEFLNEALEYYRQKYGCSVDYKGYEVNFIPYVDCKVKS